MMSYYDFVWFLISEEDKRNPTSIEYWFRILDLDGDGVLSMYELEYFYNEQIEQMRDRQIEYMPFNDLICQVSWWSVATAHSKRQPLTSLIILSSRYLTW